MENPDIPNLFEYFSAFFGGFLGGFLVEILSVYKIRRLPPQKRPDWIYSFFYWFWSFAMMLSGGALVVVYIASNVSVTPILALNIGASAPLIIGAFADKVPSISAGTIDIEN
jgi:hypothetical protein